MAKKRKGINGKQSGNSFEREWAKKISLWITNGERNDCLWRTSNSGGKATVTGSDTQCGDLHAVRPEAQPFCDLFSIELKNYKPIQLFHFGRPTFELYKWWVQAENDAERSNRIPFVIFNAKHIGQYFVLREDHTEQLISEGLMNVDIMFDPSLKFVPPLEPIIVKRKKKPPLVKTIENPLLLRPIEQLFDLFDISAINSRK